MAGTPEQNAWVETVLGVPMGVAPASPAATVGPDFNAWLAARKRFDRELDTLKDAITLRFARLGYGPKLARAFDATLVGNLRALDDRVAAAVGGLVDDRAPEPDPRRVAAARDAVNDYVGFLQSGDLADALAANPFARTSPQAGLAPALARLARALDQVA